MEPESQVEALPGNSVSHFQLVMLGFVNLGKEAAAVAAK
jgi:hypothetical protein